MLRRLLPLSLVVSGLVAGCPTGSPAAEGEGEGEGENPIAPGAPIDVGPPPFNFDATPPAFVTDDTCSTQQWWQSPGGQRESETMHPGDSCIACHTAEDEGPEYAVAGTVMNALDDGTDCRGVPGVLVELLDDADGVMFSMTTNAAGNFGLEEDDAVGLTLPYRVRLTYEGRTREMLTTATLGDCMACHTAEGRNGAPGRIVAP